jgi:hypothetical protein
VIIIFSKKYMAVERPEPDEDRPEELGVDLTLPQDEQLGDSGNEGEE